MSKVIQIAITKNFKGEMIKVNSATAIAGKGLINDRHYIENNEKKNQITLIEIENINNYNKINSSSILPTNFRRNIITEGIRLNELVGCEFLIGKVKVRTNQI